MKGRERMTNRGIVALNGQFAAEVAQVGMVYRCARCLHWNDAAAQCSLGFPVPPAWSTGEATSRGADGQFVFCKYFELD